jgi:hypothetical protein
VQAWRAVIAAPAAAIKETTMIKTFTGSAVFALALLGGCAQEKTTTEDSSSEARVTTTSYQPEGKKADYSAMMSKMDELGRTGSHHAFLNQMVGSWECRTKVWCPMQTEPIESRGTMNVKQLHGGRFIQGDFAGTMAMPGADGKTSETPFTGTKVWGYSNADGQYQGVWADSMSTSMAWMTGTASSDDSTVEMTGTCLGPDETGRLVKHTNWEKTRKISADKYVSEFWSQEPGSSKHKVMEITYSRIGAATP